MLALPHGNIPMPFWHLVHYSYIFMQGGVAARTAFQINLADITTDKIPLHDSTDRHEPSSLQAHLSREVPIYHMESCHDKLVVSCKEANASVFLAHGDLIGKFYESSQLKIVEGAWFVGEFEGMFEWPAEDGQVFFEGKIHWMQLITPEEKAFEDEGLNLVANNESSFLGYFKGQFHPWSAVGGLDNILPDMLVLRNPKLGVVEGNWNHVARQEVQRSQVKTEYILPVLVRFEIKNLGDINLQHSSAVVNGYLYLEVRFCPAVEAMLQEELKRDPGLSLQLSFNRDISLHLPLNQQDESSSDSDWSIQDKTWDIQFTRHSQTNTYHYRILKRFRSEIDNSYGAFFAPFNLSRLKIVIAIAPLQLTDKKRKIKVSFSCTDTLEYGPDGPYDPFAPFDMLVGEGEGKIPSSRQVNRYHKINRHWCVDTGQYIIADNMLTLYPHYKVILLNKSYVNEDTLWSLALRDQLPLFLPPPARPISTAFKSLKDDPQQLQRLGPKFFTFSFLRWNHAIIEIPIYKYIVIDMIKIFVPLTIITVLSLFIFQQENGVGVSSGFTTLAYRLVNIAAIALVYVSMIPIIRSSLPSMPGVTLLEIITYAETLPSLLAIVNSMLYYTIPQQEWQKTFRIFRDALFLFALALSLLNLAAFLILLVVYGRLRYRCPWKIDHYDPSVVKWHSPLYVAYMESIRQHKQHYYHLQEE